MYCHYRSVEALTRSELGASRWQALEPDVVRKIRQRKSKITKNIENIIIIIIDVTTNKEQSFFLVTLLLL